MDTFVFVTGQGLAKVKGQDGSTLSRWHTRQLRAFKADVDPRPLEKAVLAVMPARQPWLAARYFKFGAFNACPSPTEHAKQHERWYRAYGAFPVVIDRPSVDLVLRRPPRGKAVSAAAKAQLAYCDELEIVPAARRLKDAEKSHWSFWWD
jgi:hypothetical protein